MVYKKAFTIIELLVVIVVIGVLAAITFVTYGTIVQKATASAMQSSLSQMANKLESYKASNNAGELYPSDLVSAGINTDSNATYTYNHTDSNKNYCLSAVSGSVTETVTNVDKKPQTKSCIYNGLIGWWKLNGDVSDSSGLGNNGTLHGSTLVSGKNGQANGAYYFNGTASDYINVDNFDYGVLRSTSFNSSWTLSVWALWGGMAGGGMYGMEDVLIGRPGCNGGIYTYSNSYAFAIKGAGCWTGSQTIYGSALDYSWHLLTATYESGYMTFYDNGVSKGSATLLDMIPYGVTFGIGSVGDSNFNFNGTLDDARVYSRALSATEVKALYSAGAQ